MMHHELRIHVNFSLLHYKTVPFGFCLLHMQHQLMGPNPVKLLQSISTINIQDLANTLVRLYLGQGNIVSYIDMISAEEINETSRQCGGVRTHRSPSL